MNLRTRLILAFVVLSVLPLTAATLFSYRSSLDALHRAAETQASAVAHTMIVRMDSVTTNINKRLEQLCQLPQPVAAIAPAQTASGTTSGSRTAATLVTAMLGQSANMLDRLEFVASAPDPPPSIPETAAAADPRPGAPKAAPPAPHADPIVVDLSKLAREFGGNATGATPAELKEQAAALQFVTELVSAGLRMGSKEAAKATQAQLAGVEQELQALRERQAQATAESAAMKTSAADPAKMAPPAPAEVRVPKWKGEAIGVPVRRDGHVVGTVNATINLDRLLGDVLEATPAEAKEVPFAIDPSGKVHISRSGDETCVSDLHLAALADEPAGARRAGPKMDWMVVTRKDPSGVTFGIARPLDEPLREIRRVTGRNLALGLTLIGLALIGIVPLSGRMTRNLTTLTAGAQQIARGDLGVRVPVRSKDEFGRLAGAFNQMAADLQAHQQLLLTQERLQRELELCRQIQNEMLPREPLRLDLAEVRGVSIPAREVGGDFFNYFVLSGTEVALLVGDVAGKGVGAALLMANIQATLRARLPLERDLAALADAIDREIERTTPRPVYLTLFVGILDTHEKTLRYVNAGHNPQFILQAGGGVRRLPSTGLPVGMFAGHGYQERTEALADGDLLFFYTDGMTEVENEKGEFFDIQQLEDLLVAEHSDDIDTLLVRVEAAVHSFRGAAEALDDATMMALRFGASRGTAAPNVPQP